MGSGRGVLSVVVAAVLLAACASSSAPTATPSTVSSFTSASPSTASTSSSLLVTTSVPSTSSTSTARVSTTSTVRSASSTSSTSAAAPASSTTSSVAAPVVSAGSSPLVLDESHNYGDKYASGILPVGDSKYTTDAAKPGYIFVCHTAGPNAGGAKTRGSWFSADGTTYDINKKVSVQGAVSWPGSITVNLSGTTRTIATNDLPKDQTTGVFPVATSDPAHAIDPNPNTIKAQSLTFSLNAVPTVDSTPHCVSGQVGVMTTGVELFDGFDALLRDAGAWEVQDGCQGHPEITGAYHYHTLSSCIADTSVHTVIGYALDGFPITGPKVADHNILTTGDLDVCHGITSPITLDGKTVTTYHYVMTQDFPYSASCFRSTPAKAPGQP